MIGFLGNIFTAIVRATAGSGHAARFLASGSYRRGVMAGLLSVAGAVVLPGAFGVETSQAQTRQINWQSTDKARGTVCKHYGSADRSGGINSSPVYTFSDSNQNIEKCGVYANSPSRNYDGDGADVSGAFPRIAVIYGKRAADGRTQQPGLPIKVRIYRANSDHPSTSGVTVTCIVNGVERATTTGAGPNTWKIALSDGESCNLKVSIDPRTNPDWPALELTASLKRETTGNHVTMDDIRFRGGKNVGGTFSQSALRPGAKRTTATRFNPLPKDIPAAINQETTVVVEITSIGDSSTPKGTVNFLENGNKQIPGCEKIPVVEKSSGVGQATCTFTPGSGHGRNIVTRSVLDAEYTPEPGSDFKPSTARSHQKQSDRMLHIKREIALSFVTDDTGNTPAPADIQARVGVGITVYVKAVSNERFPVRGNVILYDQDDNEIAGFKCDPLKIRRDKVSGVAKCTIPGTSVTTALTEVFAGYTGDTHHGALTGDQRPRRQITFPQSALKSGAKRTTATKFNPLPKDIPAATNQKTTVIVEITSIGDSSTPKGTVDFLENGNKQIPGCEKIPVVEKSSGIATATCTFTPGSGHGRNIVTRSVLDAEYTPEPGSDFEPSTARSHQKQSDRMLHIKREIALSFVTDDTGNTPAPADIQARVGVGIPVYVKVVSNERFPVRGNVILYDQDDNEIAGFKCDPLKIRRDKVSGVAKCTISGTSATPALTEIRAGYTGDSHHVDLGKNNQQRPVLKVIFGQQSQSSGSRSASAGGAAGASTTGGPAPPAAPAPVISLDKTNPDINGEVTVTVTFAPPPNPPGGNYAGTVKVTVTGTGNPSAAIGANNCGTNLTIPTMGGTVTCKFTPTSIGEFEVSIAPGDLSDATYVFGAVTPVRGRVGPKITDLTARMTRDYLGDRNALLLSSTPDVHIRLMHLRDRGQGGAGGRISVNLGKSEDGSASALSLDLRTSLPGDVRVSDDTIAFAASARRLMGSGLFGADISDDDVDIDIDIDVGDKDDASARAQMRWDVWIEGRISRFDSNNSKDGTFGVVYLGADYLLMPNLLIGLMTQYDWLNKDYSAVNGRINGRVKGQGWMVGPYAAVRFGENLYLDIQARGGRSSNDITPIGTYTDTFKTTRWFFKGKLTGDFDYGDWAIRPGVSVQYLIEKQKAYTDTPGNAIAGQTISEGDIRIGPRIAYTHGLGDGGAIIPWAEFEGVYTFGSKDKFSKGTYASDIHGLSGGVEVGVDWRMATGSMFSLSAMYDGIGSGSRSYGARARIDIAF